jgi:deoxyribodipyrimidine photolyase-like uncharacterized protein
MSPSKHSGDLDGGGSGISSWFSISVFRELFIDAYDWVMVPNACDDLSAPAHGQREAKRTPQSSGAVLKAVVGLTR